MREEEEMEMSSENQPSEGETEAEEGETLDPRVQVGTENKVATFCDHVCS